MPGPLRATLEDSSTVRAARILVIEDNSSDVFLLDRALTKQDFPFELIHLSNGDDALAFIRRQGAYADAAVPSLILLDLNLSKYTGEDILRAIRSRRTPRRRSGLRVELFPVPARRGAAEGTRSFAGSSPSLSGLDQFMEIGKTLKDLLAAPEAG